MSMKSAMGTRKNVTPLRAALIFLIGLIIAVLMNVFVGGGTAKADECSRRVVSAFVGAYKAPCHKDFDDVISPDTRQALGNTATACGVGWAAGGPVGCGWGALGAIVGSVPWDGTWD